MIGVPTFARRVTRRDRHGFGSGIIERLMAALSAVSTLLYPRGHEEPFTVALPYDTVVEGWQTKRADQSRRLAESLTWELPIVNYVGERPVVAELSILVTEVSSVSRQVLDDEDLEELKDPILDARRDRPQLFAAAPDEAASALDRT